MVRGESAAPPHLPSHLELEHSTVATQTPRKPAKPQNATSWDTTPETVDVQETPQPGDENRIGTLSSVLGSPQEVIVGEPEDVMPEHLRNTMDLVTVRVNEEIENMSLVAGGQRFSAHFEPGHVYRVPPQVAIELERIGKVWH